MPHPNSVKQLKTYGPDALRLDKLTDEIFELRGSNSDAWDSKLGELADFVRSKQLSSLVEQLSRDKYAYNRELSAVAIWFLWEERLVVPLDENNRETYDRRRSEITHELTWTLPIMVALIRDVRSGPAELGIRAAAEMEDVPAEMWKQVRPAVLEAGASHFADVRLEAVRWISKLFPSDDNAQNILDKPAMELLLNGTRDPDERIRDWACFELWLSVANLDDDAERAFQEAMDREGQESDVYVEAVIGLARLGDPSKTEGIIVNHLRQSDFGKGWVDAAEQSHTAECLLALIAAHAKLKPGDSRVAAIEDALINWNEN